MMAVYQQVLFLFLLLQFEYLDLVEVKQSLSSVIHASGSHSCPQPTVGNCSCHWTGPYVGVTCVGLDTMPENVPNSTINLKIVNGAIKNIPQDYFLPLNKLIILDLSLNQISNRFYLPKTLISLYLNDNNLNASTIHGMFDGLTRLRNLILSSNPLGENLVPGTFSSIRNVNLLILVNCSLEDVGENMFRGLTNLDNLDLTSNKIKALKRGAFRGVSSSKEERSLTLQLGSNVITHIEDGAFEGVLWVTRLYLDHNKLSSIPSLTGLFNVTVLYLGNNNIEDISSLKRSGIRLLTILYLNDNQISELPEDIFKHISIQNLNLSFNRIKRIPPRFLENPKVPQITNYLLLSNNQIEFVDSESFAGLPNLKALYLFNNAIPHLPDGVFSNLSLQYLFLNENNISKLTSRPFKGMKTRKTSIYLFSNDILHIDDDYMQDLANDTTIIIDCKGLADLPRIKNGKIVCSPNSLKTIKQQPYAIAKALSRSGFTCHPHSDNDWYCSLCQVGTFGKRREVHTKSRTGCTQCSAGGFYQDEIGRTECKECSKGTYVHRNNTPGTTPLSCQACPQGTNTSDKAGYRACKCLPNFYRFDRFGRCFPCPSKAYKCENDYASLSAGFYWRWGNSTREKQYREFIANLMIENPEFAKGTWIYEGNLPNPHKCPRDSCLGGLNSSCQGGYQGPLCALCQQDYYSRINRCIRCPPRWWAGLQVALVIVLFVVVLLALVLGDRQKLQNENNRTIADKILSCFKIVIGFYQVMAGVYSACSNITWPSSVIWMQKFLHFIQLNILQIAPLSCITPRLSFNVLQQFVIVVVLNITVVTFILIYLVIRIAVLKKFYLPNDQIDESVAKTKSSCIRNICVFLFATYPKTCTSIIQVLSINCVQLCFSEEHAHCDSYLRSDLSVQCHTPEHAIFSRIAWAFLVYPFGFPVAIAILVRKYIYKPAVNTPAVDTAAVNTAAVDTAAVDTPAVDTAAVDTAAVDTAAVDTPAVDTPAVDTAAVDTPAVDTPAVDTAAVDTPAVDTAAVDTPAVDTAAVNTAAVDTAAVDTAAVNTAAVDTAAVDTPAVDTAAVDTAAVDTPLPRKSPFTSGLSLFSENYEDSCWYWESLEMIRKLVLISGLTLIGEHSRTQVGIGAIISAVFAILYVYKRPIKNKFENLLQTVALMAIFLNLGIGVMLKASDNDNMSPVINKHNDNLGVSIMMIIINVAVIGIVTVAFLKVVIMWTVKCYRAANEDNCSCGHCCMACQTYCRCLLCICNLTHDHGNRQGLLKEVVGNNYGATS